LLIKLVSHHYKKKSIIHLDQVAPPAGCVSWAKRLPTRFSTYQL